ncbi:ATP-binding cassette domain-containing protein [Lactococcus carnosus]|uniref:ATP-binding cassette domain-containing protein n=1 Tax=Pseudolactococcus carnosus TaxID=2749961 RepID=UPI001FBAF681|nr:ATP-binding cassette domain-containing protein [Lactococcus carnosus]MCJ1980303.1 ABC transporter ATP-binding protein [Lactococcus carnosus]
MMIKLKDFTLHAFDGTVIFENANCSFSNDKLNFIIGKSGVGKSSLLAYLSGVPFETSGEVNFGQLQRSFKKMPELINHRKKVAYIPQSFNLFEYLTVEQNIKFYSSNKSTHFDDSQYEILLKKMNLLKKRDDLVSELSIGEQQRVAVLRALTMKTPYILADEPTGNLDPENGKLIIEILEDFRKIFGATIIIVSHNYSEIPNHSKVVEIKNGKLILH